MINLGGGWGHRKGSMKGILRLRRGDWNDYFRDHGYFIRDNLNSIRQN